MVLSSFKATRELHHERWLQGQGVLWQELFCGKRRGVLNQGKLVSSLTRRFVGDEDEEESDGYEIARLLSVRDDEPKGRVPHRNWCSVCVCAGEEEGFGPQG